MAIAQTASAHSATNATQARSSTPSLPDSPSQIPYPTSTPSSISSNTDSAAWVPSEIPKTWRDSFQAWIKKTETAAAELHLYKRSGYFDGATLNNAPNEDLANALKSASSYSSPLSKAGQEEHRATIGTSVNPLDGKVGSIRLVDIGTSSTSPNSASADAKSGLSSWLFQRAAPRLVNMVEIGTPRSQQEIQADAAEEKVVLLHGYGAGTGFFYQNLATLAAHPHSRLYALDWLGMGRSARVPFHIPHAAQKTMQSRVETTENFFVSALEDWRRTMGVEKMTLVGHSLGGYLSVAYTLRYPQRVNRLVLVSPAGIGENPYEESAEMGFKSKSNGRTEDDASAAPVAAEEVELNQAQKDHVPASDKQAERDARIMKRRASEAARHDKVSEPKQKTPDPPRWGSKTRAVVSWLWEQNFSPFGIVRSSLFLGPMMTARYTSRRFGALPEEDLKALHTYCHGIFSARGSSEYALAHLLAPGAYARWPMVQRIEPIKVPTAFIYGEHDWMDVKGGEACVEKLAKQGNHAAKTFVVPHAGHHVYLDNPKAFDGLVAKILQGQADGTNRVTVPSGF